MSDAKVLDSWHTNAAPWTDAVRNREIESRRLVTDAAIVDAIASRNPTTILDIGCGEGWLVRAMAERGVRGIGVDAIPTLIERARELGDGDFRVASYEQIADGALDVRVDVAVANFALIGHEAVDRLIARVPSLLTPRGALIVQTIHPVIGNAGEPYLDGWRPGSWSGFSSAFSDPAPWYFRTIETWVRLLTESGLQLVAMREPLHPATRLPASVIFVAQMAG